MISTLYTVLNGNAAKSPGAREDPGEPMATEFDCRCAEQIIGFEFVNRSLLQASLTAAGAEWTNYDGNRKLALVGQDVMRLVISDAGYEEPLSRKKLNSMQCFVESKVWRATVADAIGIVGYLKLCERSGPPSITVKSYAISAIVGAVWKDSRSLEAVLKVMDRICLSSVEAHNLLNVAGSERIHERHDLSSSVDPQTTSATPRRDVNSPSQCLIGLDSMVSGQRNIYDLENFHNPYNIFTNDDEEAMEVLMRNHQSNAPQSGGASLLGDAVSTGYCETVTPETGQIQRVQPTSQLIEAEWFRFYVTEDEKRCTEYNLPSPWSTPLARRAMQQLAEYTATQQEIHLKIWVGLCSTHSVVVLQETMRMLRGEVDVKLPAPEMKLSARDRLDAIQTTEQQITGLSLVRRLHIFRLWKDQPCVLNDDNWINLGLSNTCMTGKRAGNPRHLQESNATKLLLEQIYPNMERPSAEYERTYRKLKRLRKLGHRLEMLSSTFGTGILGLLPCSEFVSAGSIPTISDSTLLAPSDAAFQRLILLLDHTEGDMLRRFSDATAPIIKDIFAGDLQQLDKYQLRQLRPDEILKLPRCSSMLLSCLKYRQD